GGTLDFFEREDLGPRQELVAFAIDFRRHAVGAAKVAAVGHGDAQVAQWSREKVAHGVSGRLTAHEAIMLTEAERVHTSRGPAGLYLPLPGLPSRHGTPRPRPRLRSRQDSPG